MPAAYYLNVFVFLGILLCSGHAYSVEDWDPFKDLESEHALTDEEAIDPEPGLEDLWPQHSAQWQESKDNYTISIDIGETPRASIKVETGENLIRVLAQDQDPNKPGLAKEIRVPNDADLKLMAYHFAGTFLKFDVPKKRLKSII